MTVLTLNNYLNVHGIGASAFAKKIGTSRQNIENWEEHPDQDTLIDYTVRTGVINKVTLVKQKIVYQRESENG